MPDLPDEAVQRAAGVMLSQYGSQYNASHLTWRDFADDARAVLEAAVPALAEHVAAKITAHAERQHPRDPGHIPTVWHRHFAVAAQVAGFAFMTDDDKKREAARALARGNYVACLAPEDGRP
jgi:hypothetical protein